MPYYPKINVLFIHIPKTGGSFVAGALEKHSPLLLQTGQSNTILPPPFNKYSLQHQYFTTIEKYQSLLKIDITNATVFSIVRNPYDRIVSDLFFCSLITKKSSPDEVFDVTKKYYLNDINKPESHSFSPLSRTQVLLCEKDGNPFVLINLHSPGIPFDCRRSAYYKVLTDFIQMLKGLPFNSA